MKPACPDEPRKVLAGGWLADPEDDLGGSVEGALAGGAQLEAGEEPDQEAVTASHPVVRT